MVTKYYSVGMYGERRISYADLVWRNGRKEPLGKPGSGLEVTIKFDRQEVAWGLRTPLICLRTGTGGGLFLLW